MGEYGLVEDQASCNSHALIDVCIEPGHSDVTFIQDGGLSLSGTGHVR